MKTKRMSFANELGTAVLGLLTVSGVAVSQTKEPKPNVLFIAVDDLKPVLGCYGDGVVKTPNIDRLAARGMVFSQNYCQQAVSGPSRASIMTGLRPDETKVWDLVTRMREVNPAVVTMPQYLIGQGYETVGIGKIFHQGITDQYEDKPSWSKPYIVNVSNYYAEETGEPAAGYQDPQTKSLVIKRQQEASRKGLKGYKAMQYVAREIKPSVECIDVADNAYRDGAVALRAKEELIDLHQQDKPFFFAVGFIKPHLPFNAPKKYWDLYKREEMPLASFQEHAENSPLIAYHNSGELRLYTDIDPLDSYTDQQTNYTRLAGEKQQELIHGYYASISYIDAQIGVLLNTLDSLGTSDNTVIVLWGDHGWHLGDHALWCKHSNFEDAARAPLIISAPGLKGGNTSALTEFVDVFPTVCDLIGVPQPQYLEGKSLVPLMESPDTRIKDFVVSQFPHNGSMGYSIRTDRYRLTYWMKREFRSFHTFDSNLVIAKELYDYQLDPLETVSYINDARYALVQQEMEKKMIAFLKGQEGRLNADTPQDESGFVDGFESSDGYPSDFQVMGQQNWRIYHAGNNQAPYTGRLWDLIYSQGTTAQQKKYVAQLAPEERPGGAGSQCLKLYITDDGLSGGTLRLRTLVTCPADLPADAYKITFWARVEGNAKPVMKDNANKMVTIGPEWAQYTLERFRSGNTATVFSIDFVRQADNSDYILYLDDIQIIKQGGQTLTQNPALKQELKVYPNPVNNYVTIEAPERLETISFFSVSGYKLLETESAANNLYDLSDIPHGIYFLNATSATRSYHNKIKVCSVGCH